MQKGGDPGMSKRWLKVARQETDKKKHGTLALAAVFAEKTAHAEAWREALRGWDVTGSPLVNEWTAQARAEALREGEAEGKAEALLQVLQARFGEVPAEPRSALEAVPDGERLL